MKRKRVAAIVLAAILMAAGSCKKTPAQPASAGSNTSGNGQGSGTIQPPVDPPVAATTGFFLDNWTPKTFVAPTYTDTQITGAKPSVQVSVDVANVITKVPNSIFGQNINTWMTQVVTQPVLMTHLTNLHPGVIRFPAGSLSDMYFWNADVNQPPADAPDTLVDANGNKVQAGYWYGKNTANWTLSLDNYYSVLQQTGSTGVITVNYAYARYSTSANPVAAAAHLAADWVRYDNGRTKYWEIGNEDNGTWEASYRIDPGKNKDQQPEIITGALYGQHVKVFEDSMKKAAQEIGKTIYIGAQLLEQQPASWQTNTDKTWNSGVFTSAAATPDFYIFHSYYTPYGQNSTADVILNAAIDNTDAMMTWYQSSTALAGIPTKPLALTEWNINAEGSMQKVSYISGVYATLVWGELLKNKYGEASRWDLANGWNNGNDHGLFNIGDEPGVSLWNPRPSFYYMYYFSRTAGDRLVNAQVTGSTDVKAYATSFSSGQQSVVLVNKGTTNQTVSISFQNFNPGAYGYYYMLTGGTDNGEFSRKVFVNGKGPAEISGGPADYATLKAYRVPTQGGLKFTLPPRAVIYVMVDK